MRIEAPSLQGSKRKWSALAAVVLLAVVAWFTMDGSATEAARVGWITVDAPKIRIAVVLIILSFGVRILLVDRLRPRDTDDEAGQK